MDDFVTCVNSVDRTAFHLNHLHVEFLWGNTPMHFIYTQNSNTSHTLVANKIVDPSDVVGAVTTGTALSTYSFSNNQDSAW